MSDGVNRVNCDPTAAFFVNFLGFNDVVDADQVTGGATLEAHGAGGDDGLSGTQNADRLFGDAGSDGLTGKGGNDLLDGGPGENYMDDGLGDDTSLGGPNNDTFIAGPGRDIFAGGDGTDTVDYRARTGAVTITLNGVADDGEATEGDNAGADIESAFGGSGSDRIVGGPNGNTLRGGAGNDSITGGVGEQRIEGDEGDDLIDSRDGVYDSIDCGPGNDTVFADAGDFTTGCEIAPDRDGDGTVNEADCAPDDAAVHPGAGEVFGNPIDEDCKGGPGYFRVASGISFRFVAKKRPARVRVSRLRITSLRAGDRIEVRCRGGKAKGCAFSLKKRTARSGQSSVNVASLFKKRFLRRNAVVEVRVLRVNFIGRVLQLKVTNKADLKQTPLCLGVGATKPGRCPTVG